MSGWPRTPAAYLKFIMAALTAAGVTAQAAVSDGVITGDEWWKIGFSAAGALLVLLAPNKQSPATTPREELKRATAGRRGPAHPPSAIEEELPEVRPRRGKHEI